MSAKKGKNYHSFGRWKGASASNLRRWESEFKKDPANFGNDDRHKNAGRKVKYPELDEHIKGWFQKLREPHTAISGRMLILQAQKFLNLKNIKDLQLSEGWKEKILKRLNIVRRRTTHIAQKSPILYEKEIQKFIKEINEYR